MTREDSPAEHTCTFPDAPLPDKPGSYVVVLHCQDSECNESTLINVVVPKPKGEE